VKKRIPIVALCGFLGSGKTTLLRRWRADSLLENNALIIHDLSELGIDAEILSIETQILEAGKLNGRMAALHGKHATEYLHDSLKKSLDSIYNLNPKPSVILSESTGAARPWPLIKALTQDERFYLKHFIITIDALNLFRDFQNGSILTGEESMSSDPAIAKAALILAEQIAFSSVIILTKIDAISEEVLNIQIKNIKKIQPNVPIGLSAQAGLNLSQLEEVPSPDIDYLESISKSIGISGSTSVAQDVEVSLFYNQKPFHPERFYSICQNNLGTGLYRTKGFLWLASRPGDALLWQQSGSQISLELKGKWRAEVAKNSDGRLLPEEIAGMKKKLMDMHPVFGDRCNELTLIGLKKDREGFLSALEYALCTDDEVNDWINKKKFMDPWPKTLKKVNL